MSQKYFQLHHFWFLVWFFTAEILLEKSERMFTKNVQQTHNTFPSESFSTFSTSTTSAIPTKPSSPIRTLPGSLARPVPSRPIRSRPIWLSSGLRRAGRVTTRYYILEIGIIYLDSGGRSAHHLLTPEILSSA